MPGAGTATPVTTHEVTTVLAVLATVGALAAAALVVAAGVPSTRSAVSYLVAVDTDGKVVARAAGEQGIDGLRALFAAAADGT